MSTGILSRIIKNRKVTLFFAVALTIFGLYNYWLIPKQENPEIAPPVAKISVIYPGASPEEIEESVTKKVEEELGGVPGYDYIESYSRNSLSTTILWLNNDADVDKSWDILRQKMDDLQSELPDGCEDIEIDTELDKTAGFIISISGKNYSYEQLAAFAEDLKQKVVGINGISKMEILGKQEKQVKVNVNYSKLNQISLSFNDLADILKAQNIKIPSGDIDDNEFRIIVNIPGKFKSTEEIANLVIGVSSKDGSVVYLKDVAVVSLETEEAAVKIKHNRENAVLLVGYFEKNKNILLIGQELESSLNDIKKSLPSDLSLENVLYQPDDIKASINNLMKNLLQGILFVILTVYFGMGLQNAIIVSLAIPLSIIITFSVMSFFGIQLNQIAIAGLIISLGMLVDNAIVVSDAIQVRMDTQENRLDSCINGVKDVAIPVLTATLTTVVAYIPLLILPGTAGEYIRSIPQIVMISLSSSYLVALFFTPTMAYLFFRDNGGNQKRFLIGDIFKHLSVEALKRKKTVVLSAGTVFLLSILLVSFLTLVFFPKADKNIVYLDVKAEHTANLNKTEKLADKVDDILLEQKEVVHITTSIGEGLPKFFMTTPSPVKSLDTAQTMVSLDLKKGGRFKNNTQFAEHLQNVIDNSICGGTVTVKELEQAEPVEAPLIVRIMGDDRDSIQKVADRIEETVKGIQGTVNVENDAGEKEYQYLIDIDTARSSQLGLTRYEIENEINIALRGKVTSTLRTEKGREYDILVKSNIRSIGELENLAIKSGITGNKTTLKQIAQVKLIPQFSYIKRYDGKRVVNVLSDVKLGYSAVDIQNELQKKLKNIDTEDLNITFDGEKSKIKKHFGNLGVAAAFALFAIYIIMMIQFGSLSQPLIILISIPLSIIGSIIGLLVFRQPLSFTALLGVVSLIGVVVNNAIILIDYINWQRKQGNDVEQSCRYAVEKRVRPILLTTGTTVLGLIPLIFSGTLFVPMAVSLMSGLLVSTLLTLVIIPVVYSLIEKNKMII